MPGVPEQTCSNKDSRRRLCDPAIVAATMARPGVVLRRPVGSAGAFVEHAHLPKHLPAGKADHEAAKTRAERKAPPGSEVDHKVARAAAVAFDREQKRRETERRKEEAARERQRKLREQAIAKAQSSSDAGARSEGASDRKRSRCAR